MAYFLKKTNNKKGTYLQIYESFYDPVRKQTAHRSIRPVGYVHELEKDGIEDPIAHFREEVASMNEERKKEKEKNARKISEDSPERYLGYFPLKNINDSLSIRSEMETLQNASHRFEFSVYSLMSALLYARAVQPCSKSRTFHEVLPLFYEKYDFSKSQMYEGISYIGSEYEKIIEIYNDRIRRKYGRNTDHTYFDCTNFYFEIDREDDLRRKGPSKENRKDPIIGMGLLLDADRIPLGMKIYPGNESEKPVIREVIDSLKRRNHIEGRTIQIADKGLNCGQNIYHALAEKDGYIFSKSVKQLKEDEREWVFLENGDFVNVTDSNGVLLYRYKECVDNFDYTFTDRDGKTHKFSAKEKRIATYNPKLASKQLREINKQVEKAEKLRMSEAKKSEFGDSSKYVRFVTEDGNKAKVEMNNDAIEKAKKCCGYNMLVTSEISLEAQEIYDAYHNLWRIEESFKAMKSQLDARPVYLQKENSIEGHFLICYLTVLLERILQFKVLDNKYSTEEIFKFMKSYRIVKATPQRYINLTPKSDFISDLAEKENLPVDNYYLNNENIKMMLNHRFRSRS